MKQSFFVLAAAIPALIGIESAARAQVCTQPSPGVAQITTTTAATALKVTGGTTRANTVNCGFLASSITVTGIPGNETLTLTSIPATVPVSIDLGGGANNLTINLTAGDDTATCGATSCNRDASGGADATWVGSLAKLSIHGKAGNDTITISAYAGITSLYGEDGNDTITGGTAKDTISGGNGDDVLNGGGGDDVFTTLATFDGFDTINGNAGADTATYALRQGNLFLGLDGGEDIIGNSTESITGGAGNDTLDFSSSGVGRTIRGGAGSDLIRGSDFADLLYGGDGDDSMFGGSGADKLYGQDGFDDLTGEAGNDVYYGGNDDDQIFSNDSVTAEVVHCDAGNDTYIATNDAFTACENPAAVVPFANGSFETGDYTSWTIIDEVVGGEDIWGIGMDGVRIRQNDLVHDYESGLDQTYVCGDGPTPIATDGGLVAAELQFYQSTHRIYQDVTVPANAQTLWLSIGYLMFGNVDQPDPTFDPATQFIALTLRDPATDAVLPNGELFKTTEGAAPDELPMLNLYADVSAFAGQSVRVNVEAMTHNFCIPLQLDNFRFLVSASPFAPKVVAPSTIPGISPTLGDGHATAPLTFARPAPQASSDTADEESDELDGDDTAADESDEAAGGCSATGGSSSLVFGLLIGVALITRRRRRA